MHSEGFIKASLSTMHMSTTLFKQHVNSTTRAISKLTSNLALLTMATVQGNFPTFLPKELLKQWADLPGRVSRFRKAQVSRNWLVVCQPDSVLSSLHFKYLSPLGTPPTASGRYFEQLCSIFILTLT